MSKAFWSIFVSVLAGAAAYQQVVSYPPYVRSVALAVAVVILSAQWATTVRPWIADRSAGRNETPDDVRRRRRRRFAMAAFLLAILNGLGIAVMSGTTVYHSVRTQIEGDSVVETLVLHAPSADSASVTVSLLRPLESATQCQPSQRSAVPAKATQWSWGGANPELRITGFISPQSLALRCAPPVPAQVDVRPLSLRHLDEAQLRRLFLYFIAFGSISCLGATSYLYLSAFRS